MKTSIKKRKKLKLKHLKYKDDFPLMVVDDHFGKPNRKKKPSNMGRKELVSR